MSDFKEDPHFWQKRAFDRQDERFESQIDAAIESGHHAVKAALILNGGACVALLAFLANTMSKAPEGGDVGRLLALMIDSLSFFAAGALLAAVTAGLGYLTNLFAGESAASRSKHFEPPFIRDTTASKRWGGAYAAFAIATIATAVLSYAAFAAGLAKIRGWI